MLFSNKVLASKGYIEYVVCFNTETVVESRIRFCARNYAKFNVSINPEILKNRECRNFLTKTNCM